MAKTLRTLSDPDFTTKNNTLTWEELDQNLIDIWNQATTLSEGNDSTMQTNLGLKNGSADLDFNSLHVRDKDVGIIIGDDARSPRLGAARDMSPGGLSVQPSGGSHPGSVEIFPQGTSERSHFLACNAADPNNFGFVKFEARITATNNEGLIQGGQKNSGVAPDRFRWKDFPAGVIFEDIDVSAHHFRSQDSGLWSSAVLRDNFLSALNTGNDSGMAIGAGTGVSTWFAYDGTDLLRAIDVSNDGSSIEIGRDFPAVDITGTDSVTLSQTDSFGDGRIDVDGTVEIGRYLTGSSAAAVDIKNWGDDSIITRFLGDGTVQMHNGAIETNHFSDWFSANPTGWQATYGGVGDFRTLYIDELIAKAFTVDVAQALAGSDILTKSVGILDQNFTIPAVSSTGTMVIEDLAGLADFQAFETGDWIRLRIVDRTSGLTIGDVYGTVSSYTDNADGTQSWTFTTDYAGPSDALVGQVANKGAVVLDYGVSGDAFIERTVLDRSSSTDFSKTPYDRIVRWTNSGSGGPRPSASGYNAEVLTQLGNINGLGGFSTPTYGAYLKDNLVIELDGGAMNVGKNVGGAGVDGIHLGANDYWYSDKTGSVGGGIMNWTGSQINFANFTAEDDYLTDGNVYIGNELNRFNDAGNVLMGQYLDGSLPLVKALGPTNTTYALMYGRSGTGEDIFRISVENNFVVSVSEDEAKFFGAYADATDLWGGSATKTDAGNIRLDFANSLMTDNDVWRISGSSGLDFQGGESGINKIEWRDGDFDNNTLLMGELYAYHDTTNDETNFVMRAQNTVASKSIIFLTSTELQVNADSYFQNNVEFENTINVNYAPGAIVNGYFSFGANDDGTSGRMRLPHFTDTTRPSSPNTGEIIFNTDAGNIQFADNAGNWQGV